jgi:hypothetical protein
MEKSADQLKQAVEGQHGPKATRAYLEGRDKRRFYAVLHLGGIRSPLDAMRAAIVAERRT